MVDAPMKQHAPQGQIAAGNPWYQADQFHSQLGSPGRRRVIENRWRVFGEMIREWRQRWNHTGALTLLDAGCGDGINLVGLRRIEAADRLQMRLFGVDYNPLRLQRARLADAGAGLHLATLCHLPHDDATFDVVLCNHVIEHVPELARALSELCRVVRPGGLVMVGVPNEGCLMARARNRVIQPAILRTTDHVNFFTEGTLTRALADAGLHVRHVERETFFFPHSYINAGLNEIAAGHWLMAGLRRVFPSQAGGLMVAAERPVAGKPPAL